MVTDHVLDDLDPKCEVRNVELMFDKSSGDARSGNEEYQASVGFQVIESGTGIGEGDMKQLRFPLKYNVHFVGAHPFRPPHGHVGAHSPRAAGAGGTGVNEILSRSNTVKSNAAIATTTTSRGAATLTRRQGSYKRLNALGVPSLQAQTYRPLASTFAAQVLQVHGQIHIGNKRARPERLSADSN